MEVGHEAGLGSDDVQHTIVDLHAVERREPEAGKRRDLLQDPLDQQAQRGAPRKIGP